MDVSDAAQEVEVGDGNVNLAEVALSSLKAIGYTVIVNMATKGSRVWDFPSEIEKL